MPVSSPTNPEARNAGLMERLCFDSCQMPLPSVVIAAAHPDDETIGAASRLARLAQAILLVHITDGAPADMHDAEAAGFETREEYARIRYGELLAALREARIGPERCRRLGLIDQEASMHLSELAVDLAKILDEANPDIILTHAYEGGHPDHDAVALAVHAACKLVKTRSPLVVEFALYHGGPTGMTVFDFLPCPGHFAETVSLIGGVRAMKQKMLDCFVTQKAVLSLFTIEKERYRPAPSYDFTLPPHTGRLFYEDFSWGMDSRSWRLLAARALKELGMAVPI